MAKKAKTVTPEDAKIETAESVVEEIVAESPEHSDDVEKTVETATESADEAVSESADEAVAETVDEAVAETANEAVAETVDEAVAEDVDEAVAESADEAVAETDETEEAANDENGDEDSSPSEFMNIEHFADYRRKDEAEPVEQICETADEGEADKGEAAEDVTVDEQGEVCEQQEQDADGDDEFREYENMTILDEVEDEPEDTAPAEEYKIPKDEEPYDESKPRKVDARFDFVELFVCMMVIIMLLSTFVFRHSVVDGGSMESTLHHGEHLIISNFFYEPKQYDIIVCEDYTTGLKKPIIKRVIATEGQTVRVLGMDEVYVDGVLVDTSFILIDGKEDLVYANVYPIECVVPEGEVFVMGDHRNSSLDSRMLGTIDEDTILGKVVLRFYPFNRFGKVE